MEKEKNKPVREDDKLKFPLVPWGNSMRYDIPLDMKPEVINSLNIFTQQVPLYDGVYKDIHSDIIVKGSELEVIWENGHNYVVSPHYNESGGTLIDLMSVEKELKDAKA